MSTNQEKRRSDVIRCEFCGEDYSVTYRRCPFCDDKAGVPTETRTRAKGGRRVAPTNKRGGGYGGSLRPVQVIGIALSIILIIAAIYIVYSVLSPLFADDEGGSAGSNVSVSQSDVSGSDTSNPDVSGQPDVSEPVVVPDPDASSGVVTPVVKATGVTLSKSDVTAQPNEKVTLKATLTPSNSDDAVVWSSSDETVAKVDQNGVVTNVNTGSRKKDVTITATAGNVSATCLVRCVGGSSGTTQTPGGNTQTGSQPTANFPAIGIVTGASGGLSIRSGPGTNYQRRPDGYTNGQEVNLLGYDASGDGWYKIRYYDTAKRQETEGYVAAKYITVK